MANIPSKPGYGHGSTGSQPSSPIDYANGDPLESDNLDYYINTEFVKIKALIDWANTIDSNDDGTVDAADTASTATDATNVTSTYKGNDIDSDGDGVVDESDQTQRFEVRTNDPSSPADGRVWIRSDL